MKNDCMHSMRDRASGVEMLGSGQFYGTNVRSWRRPGMMLSETHYSPNLKVPRHEHEPAYFCFLLDGGYWEQYGSRRVTYRPHSIVFHPAGDLHRGRIGSSGGRCFNIQLKPEWLNRMHQHDEVPDEPVDRHSGELVWLGLRMHRVFRRREPGSDLTVEGLTLEMLGSLLAENRKLDPRIPEWLKAADEIVHEEFASPLTIAAVAEDLDVSPVRLSRAFRGYFKESMGERLRRIRVDYAARRLREDDAPLSTVALDAGFADQSHFTKVFRRATGFTPAEYRRSGS